MYHCKDKYLSFIIILYYLSFVMINLLEALNTLCLLCFYILIKRKLCPLHAACGHVLRKTTLGVNGVFGYVAKVGHPAQTVF